MTEGKKEQPEEKAPAKEALKEADIEKGDATAEQIEEVSKLGGFYLVKEVADEFNFTRAWVTQLCTSGRIKAIKPSGGQWRIPASEVERIRKEGIQTLPRKKKEPEVTRIKVPGDKIDKVAPHREEEKAKEEEDNPYWPLPFKLKSKE